MDAVLILPYFTCTYYMVIKRSSDKYCQSFCHGWQTVVWLKILQKLMYMWWRRIMFSRFSNYSETNASELLENLTTLQLSHPYCAVFIRLQKIYLTMRDFFHVHMQMYQQVIIFFITIVIEVSNLLHVNNYVHISSSFYRIHVF